MRRSNAGHAAVARLATCRGNSRPISASSSMTISTRSKAEWRRFEHIADCTAFQTFDWLAAWHRHIGRGKASGRSSSSAATPTAKSHSSCRSPSCRTLGTAAVLARPGSVRLQRAAVGARFFAARHTRKFPRRLARAARQMQCEPPLRYDWIEFEKMPKKVGTQLNPFTYLDVTPNPSSAHLTQLGDDWEKFYFAKRSSATRRRDRAKRRHMSAIRRHPLRHRDENQRCAATLETLIDQEARAFARRGIRDIFARPGLREFFLDLASNPKTRHLVPYQPRRSRRRPARRRISHRVRRLLLSCAGELRGRRRGVALRTRRAASA